MAAEGLSRLCLVSLTAYQSGFTKTLKAFSKETGIDDVAESAVDLEAVFASSVPAYARPICCGFLGVILGLQTTW